MKYLLRIACAIMLLSFFNCTTELVDNQEELFSDTESQDVVIDTPEAACFGQSPKARITNNGSVDVNLEIYNESGNLVSDEINAVEPGEVSSWITFSSGETTFVVSNNNASKIIVIDMGNCMAYDMIIGTNNQLTSDQPMHL